MEKMWKREKSEYDATGACVSYIETEYDQEANEEFRERGEFFEGTEYEIEYDDGLPSEIKKSFARFENILNVLVSSSGSFLYIDIVSTRTRDRKRKISFSEDFEAEKKYGILKTFYDFGDVKKIK
jgi:hypothetical protein